MTRNTTTPATIDETADAGVKTPGAVEVPAGPPAPGTLVVDDNGRYGIVVDAGREPGSVFDAERNRELDESHEPLVLWFSGVPSPYGLTLTTVLPPG